MRDRLLAKRSWSAQLVVLLFVLFLALVGCEDKKGSSSSGGNSGGWWWWRGIRARPRPGKTRKPVKEEDKAARVVRQLTNYTYGVQSEHGTQPDLETLKEKLQRYPYEVRWPKDPWGAPYVYEVSGDDFAIFSMGPDGKAHTEDDIK